MIVVQLILLKNEPVVVAVEVVEPITDDAGFVEVERKTFETEFVIVGFTEEELFIIIKINILNFYYTT
jgi:hypothetical protein